MRRARACRTERSRRRSLPLAAGGPCRAPRAGDELHDSRQRRREAVVVRDHHHRLPSRREIDDHIEHLGRHRGIEGAGRLVEEHHPRPHRQGPGDRHPLLLAAGERGGPGRGEGRQADAVEQRRRPGPAPPRRAPPSTTRGASVTLSSTERCGKRLNCWNTMPTSRRSSLEHGRGLRGPGTSRWPAIVIAPASNVSRPLRQRSSVLLPLPDGPTTAVTPAAPPRRLTASSTGLPAAVLRQRVDFDHAVRHPLHCPPLTGRSSRDSNHRESERERPAHAQVEHRRHHRQFHDPAGRERQHAVPLRELDHGDRRADARVLEQRDEVARHRRHHDPHRLRHDHVPQRLPLGEPEREGRLELPGRHRLEPRPVDLRLVGRVVEREAEDRGHERRQREARPSAGERRSRRAGASAACREAPRRSPSAAAAARPGRGAGRAPRPGRVRPPAETTGTTSSTVMPADESSSGSVCRDELARASVAGPAGISAASRSDEHLLPAGEIPAVVERLEPAVGDQPADAPRRSPPRAAACRVAVSTV